MTFSYNLVLALFLLAPGFAAYAGLFFTTHRDDRLHPAPPAPGSVLTLALVTVAALALHSAWAVMLAAQDAWTAAGLPHGRVPFEPNVYVEMLNAGRGDGPGVSGAEVALTLATLLGLSAAGYLATARLVTSRLVEGRLRTFLYGWAAHLIEQLREREAGYVRVATAFVLTKIDHDGLAFGYEGALRNMTLNADKEITSLTLSEVTAFYVKLEAGRFKRTVLAGASRIPTLYLEKGDVRNIAFQIIRVRT